MTAVARVLPRDWDGHRLLRFLTGLAMLALAFAAHLAPARLETAAPAPVLAEASIAAPAPVVADAGIAAPAPVAATSIGAAPQDGQIAQAAPAVRIATPATELPVGSTVPVLVAVLVLAGLAMRVRGNRGPPLLTL
ncbi:hypothetical protein KOI35_23585 [Actinoplanes bogorensis]|uniref:Uncharacterized protein n=1 Tax=Paractinoplanes bogorensis TaxID=1610840 RepID=A0ABS5YSS2_9ACTN|nr:hypothetical protein [Actinoplanes bogorensis]MBU2666493.1 hypothetical protein [Actinoplanes bogorensis]